jgi:hypothetical protein
MYRKSKQSYHGAMAKRARKGEQHDYNADPANRRKKLVLTGARSVLDLTGARSYRAMRQQLPEAQPRTPEPVAARLGEHSHESEDQRVSEAGTAQQITQQVLALTQENRPHAPIVLPDPKELAHLRSDAPEIYALYVKAVDTQIEDESYTRRAPFEIPDRFTRRGQYLGFVSVLASLGVVAYAIYTNHPLIAGIIGALNLVALAAVFVAPDRASKGEE